MRCAPPPTRLAQPGEYSADELKEADAVKAAVEAQSNGSLELYTPSEEDAAHWWVCEFHADVSVVSATEVLVKRCVIQPRY